MSAVLRSRRPGKNAPVDTPEFENVIAEIFRSRRILPVCFVPLFRRRFPLIPQNH
jgi:hypothetical protein